MSGCQHRFDNGYLCGTEGGSYHLNQDREGMEKNMELMNEPGTVKLRWIEMDMIQTALRQRRAFFFERGATEASVGVIVLDDALAKIVAEQNKTSDRHYAKRRKAGLG